MVSYLSDRDIDADGKALLGEAVKSRLGMPDAMLRLERIDATMKQIAFGRNQSSLTSASETGLDDACVILNQHAALQIEITGGAERGERAGIAAARAQAIVEYFSSKCHLEPERVVVRSEENAGRNVSLRLTSTESPQ